MLGLEGVPLRAGQVPLEQRDGLGLLVPQVLGEAFPAGDQAHRQGRPDVVVGTLGQGSEPGVAGRQQRVDLGVLGLHRHQRPPVVGGHAGEEGRPQTRVLTAVVVMEELGEDRPAPRQGGPAGPVLDRGGVTAATKASRSLRKAWCIRYIALMSRGPAAWPSVRAA